VEKKKTVLYIYPHLATFIKRDFRIIEKHYRLQTYGFNPAGYGRLLISFVKQFFYLLSNLGNTDIIVCMFLGYHSFLPSLFARLFRKPCLSIIGGTESHNYPSINYGSLRKPVYAWFTKISYLNSTHIAPVHESLVLWKDDYYAKDFPMQGYRYFFPGVKVPFTTVYNGYDSEEFKPVQGVHKEANTFLTVAGTLNSGEFYRKGADLIIEAARAFPEYRFTIISTSNSSIPDLPNLRVIPTMPVHELLPYFSSHEFYFQLSIAEGFPNALCEAMLCECIPIGSSVYGIPLIIGDSGFVLQKKDFRQLKNIITEAVVSDKKVLAKAARERIKNEFSEERREKELVKLISRMIDGN
jgi:glycosyltransferase involved in cell wall biosynthesis